MGKVSQHAPHSPSGLQSERNCKAKFKLSQGLEQEDSEIAKFGTECHEACEKRSLKGLNVEQDGLVRFAIEYLDSLIEKYNPINIYYEEPIEIYNEDGSILTYGTADVIMECEDMCIICDYKFGYKLVEVEDNMQFKTYSCGVMQRFKKPVLCVAVQPRLNLAPQFFFNGMMKDLHSEIKKIIDDSENADINDTCPSEDNCKYCLAAGITCFASYNKLVDIFEDVKQLTNKITT